MRDKLEAAYKRTFCRDTLAGFQCEQNYHFIRFHRLLDAEAWLDAAMMLVPEGRGRGAFAINRDSFGRAYCNVWTDAEFNRYVHGSGATPAEALLAAILSTKESSNA